MFVDTAELGCQRTMLSLPHLSRAPCESNISIVEKRVIAPHMNSGDNTTNTATQFPIATDYQPITYRIPSDYQHIPYRTPASTWLPTRTASSTPPASE